MIKFWLENNEVKSDMDLSIFDYGKMREIRLGLEHNLDVIKCADNIIDLGPDGGDKGGTVVVTGTPEEVAACDASYTGRYLKKLLQQ